MNYIKEKNPNSLSTATGRVKENADVCLRKMRRCISQPEMEPFEIEKMQYQNRYRAKLALSQVNGKE